MKKCLWLISCAAVFLVCFSARAEGLMAGAAVVDITPEGRVPLAGYFDRLGKKSKGVHDRVYSRALVLESGGMKVAIVSNDILLITAPLKQEVMELVEDIELDGLVLAATHTHSGPGGYVDVAAVKVAVMGGYHEDVRELLVRGMARAIRQADENLAPARFGSAVVDAGGLSRNRRHGEGGATDPSLGVIKIEGRDGGTIACLVNFAAHPTVLSGRNRLISGDYAGALERELEAGYAGGAAMFIPGALGDQSLVCPDSSRGFDCVERGGHALAERVREVAAGIETTDDVTITYYRRMIEMPERQMKSECFGGFAPLMGTLGKKLIRERAEIAAVRINETLLLANPAEVAVEVGFHLKEQHPGDRVFVLAHCNDYLGYVLTPEEYALGGYESCMNFYGPEFEPYLEEQFMSLFEE